MTNCSGCGKPIEDEYELDCVEKLYGRAVYVTKFHGFRCLIRSFIRKGMIEVELRACE